MVDRVRKAVGVVAGLAQRDFYRAETAVRCLIATLPRHCLKGDEVAERQSSSREVTRICTF